MKRFKSKKRFKKIYLYLALFLLSIILTSQYLAKNNLLNNNSFLSFLINDTFDNKINYSDFDFFLKYAFGVDEDSYMVSDESDEIEPVIKEDLVTEEPLSQEPLIYIYNTHQEEKYQSSLLEVYNISSTVLIAAKMLKEYLGDLGVNAYVEEANVADTLHALNLKYGSSYKVTRTFMENAKEKMPSLTYFIDLHRDSSSYEKTSTTINGEKYARLLFVVGLDHDNYEPNLALAEKLRAKIDAYDSTLCRGIMKKSGKGVNGIYNQDFSEKVMLIEVGGQYNNISEVNNTLKVLAQILKDFVKEDFHE